MDQVSINHLYVTSLISGLLGALIGGFLSYRGAMDATKKNIEALYEHERKRRVFDKEKQGRAMLEAVIAESKQNINLAIKWITSHSKTPFSTEAWSLFKGAIDYLDSDVQEKVLALYSEIARYNALVDYDKAVVPFGSGAMDSAIQAQAGVIKTMLEGLIPELGGCFRAVEEEESQGLTYNKPENHTNEE